MEIRYRKKDRYVRKPSVKLACNEIEDRLVRNQGRRVNLDIGFLDHNKVVLASAKYAGQKIHLGDGIYADLIARFREGKYQPFEWTFPDSRDGRYDNELAQIRRTYLCQLRALAAVSNLRIRRWRFDGHVALQLRIALPVHFYSRTQSARLSYALMRML